MIIKARHHFIIYPFMKVYAKFMISRHFTRVVIKGDFHDKNLPVLILSNHISWWDGFWIMYLNLYLLRRKFYFMMLEGQLKRYSFFINSGGFSVRKGSRSILESINYSAELLSEKKNMLMLFPQGRINSMHNQSIDFERGIEKILDRVKGDIHILFVANLVDYFSDRKPSLFIYLREYSYLKHGTGVLKEDYNSFYASCVSANSKIPEGQ